MNLRPSPAFTWAALLAVGCAHSQPAESPAPPPPVAYRPTFSDVSPIRPAVPADARFPAPVILDISLLTITVPAGSISRNQAFWKPVHPPVLDAATDDLLDDNGVRVGVAASSDWPLFKKIFDAVGAATVQGHYIGPGARNQEVAPTGEIANETLFYFDRHGVSGKVYDQCENLLGFAYAPSSSRGAVRLELTPVVRGMRRHYSYTIVNDEEVVDYVGDEQLFDLNLCVDLPPGEFLIVAPSAQSERTTSIGHQFLTRDGVSGRTETILIFVADTPAVGSLAVSAPAR